MIWYTLVINEDRDEDTGLPVPWICDGPFLSVQEAEKSREWEIKEYDFNPNNVYVISYQE